MGLSIVFFPLIPWLVRFQTLDETHEERSVWRKVKDFYSAPATKFTATVVCVTFHTRYKFYASVIET